MQKKAEHRIKHALMLEARGLDSAIWAERAGETLAEMDEHERSEMNYWEWQPHTGSVEFVWGDVGGGGGVVVV